MVEKPLKHQGWLQILISCWYVVGVFSPVSICNLVTHHYTNVGVGCSRGCVLYVCSACLLRSSQRCMPQQWSVLYEKMQEQTGPIQNLTDTLVDNISANFTLLWILYDFLHVTLVSMTVIQIRHPYSHNDFEVGEAAASSIYIIHHDSIVVNMVLWRAAASVWLFAYNH